MDIAAAKDDTRLRADALAGAFEAYKAATLELNEARGPAVDPAVILRLEHRRDEAKRVADRAREHFLDGYLPIREALRADRARATNDDQRAAAQDALKIFEAEFGRHKRDEAT
jgi:hypothetical protein